jgi:hypothetical protein
MTPDSQKLRAKTLAKDENVAVNRLNEFGLSQVLKGGKNNAVGNDTASVKEATKKQDDAKVST